jgi:uncharacterized lipoprotein YmbA
MNLRHHLSLALFPLVLLLAGGCASSPRPDLYVMAAEDGWRTVAVRDQATSAYTVRFAPVVLPAYLDRPQLVVRESSQRIRTEPFHRWGSPLDITMVEIIGSAVARTKPSAYVDVITHRSPPSPGYLVHIDLVRLDGPLGGEVELIAQWRVVREGQADGAPVAQRLVRFVEPTASSSHAAYVEAIRVLLTRLGEDIASVME